MSVHKAWSLVCRLFAGGSPVLRAALSQSEVRACALLGPAVKPTIVSRAFALCPYCHRRLHFGADAAELSAALYERVSELVPESKG
jgi:hypothetical protein